MSLEVSTSGILDLPSMNLREGLYLIEYMGARSASYGRRMGETFLSPNSTSEEILVILRDDIESLPFAAEVAWVQIYLWDQWHTLFRYTPSEGLENLRGT